MNKLYNKDLKLAYIENYFGEENTKNTILFVFTKSSEVEEQYNKDIYAFNDKEIASLLLYFKRDNIMSLYKDLSILKDYVNWCIVNGKRGIYENGENRITIFQKTEDLFKYISIRKVKNKYLTKDEFNDLINYLVNPIDQAFILAIYEFINGEKLHELRSLTIQDVNKAKLNNNKIELTNLDGSKRYSYISDRLIELLEDANKQVEYVLDNGMSVSKSMPLTESDYVFRMITRKSKINKMANYAALINKLNLIKKFTGYDLITVNSIKETRIIHEITDMTKQYGLTKTDDEIYRIAFANICKTYDVKFSETQVYNIKRKYEQVTKLKEF